MRKNFRPWAVAGIMVAGLLQTSGVLLAETAPVVHVSTVVKDGTVRLEADSSAPFEYTTYRPNSTLFVVDITGVTVDVSTAGDAQVVDAGPVRSYRLIPYESGDKASTRLEVLLRTGVEPRIERDSSSHLTLVIASPGVTGATGATRSEVRTVEARAEVQGSATAESISDVHLAQAGERTVVDVTGSGRLNYHMMRLTHPDRLVLDFSGAYLRTAEKSIPSNLDPVRVIRLAQFRPEVARVVIDLRQPAPFSVSADGNSVKVEFMPVRDSKTPVESSTGASTVTTKTHATRSSGVSDSVAHNESPLALPASLTQTNSALAMPAPGAATVFPVKAEIGAATPAAAAAASRAGAGVQTVQAAGVVGGYSGEPISVNLKDVDLRDFFRLIHEISGLNVVLDPGVKGSLTIVLDDVPWDQALDIVLQNNDLDKQLQGNVLRIATKDTIKKEAEQERDIAKAQAEAADVVTTTRVLSYAKSDDMVNTLKKFLSPRGDVLSDARSNTVIIRDIPAVIPVMDNLIRQLDRRTQQVEIEARVVSASRTFARDIGSQLAFAAGRGNTTVGGNQQVGTSSIGRPTPPPLTVPGGSSSTGYQMPLTTALGAAVPTSGLSYLFTSANFALDYVITAAEQKGVGKLLSKPKITTQNNQTATIKQGTKLPVQTIVNNTVSVQFIDVVLELQVTPQITADGNVFMDVKVTNDQIDSAIPRVQGIPAIDTQSIENRILINDGGTVMMGGIIVSNQQTSIQQVPIIGSLPLVGNLFKRTTVSSSSQELMFFLTPRIMPG
jgi:type IV pilus secretin PilQ/predicted competence protein